MRSLTACIAVCFVAAANPAGAGTAGFLIPPVDAAIARPFEAPPGPYGPGHRGVDYAVPTGTRIRAAAEGTVIFAGSVAGSPAVTIQHDDGVRTTYSVLSRILVHTGDRVHQGEWVGLSGFAHPGQGPGLHFGVKVGNNYVDPTGLFGATDVTEALHLAPLAWRPAPAVERLLALPHDAGDYRRPCARPAAIGETLPPPDRNIAVAIGGIGSQTAGGVPSDLYGYGPNGLGYSPKRVFWFSYRGIRGPRFHTPYTRADTYGDLRVAARRLRRLMVALGRRFPGADVDLFGHSQGGIVARLYLESQAAAWDPRLPRVAHLVTLASPNEGAPLAEAIRAARTSDAGRSVLQAASRWARSGGPLPDPLSPAVGELAPGSPLLTGLARQDVAYGTQVLALAAPLDVVVPADRAGIPGQLNRVVPPNGLSAHSAIVRSESARRIEYSFLRGGPVACRSWWDDHGRELGAGIGWIEGRLGAAAGTVGRALSGMAALAGL
ncbi:MAG: peptidoglycan DD-metalloendopeptidase family protein [Actinomycetota bacterium]|nr:peptidoglycan DD-metalloendopeptidase family protein [Actinomycetota bacterium]